MPTLLKIGEDLLGRGMDTSAIDMELIISDNYSHVNTNGLKH